MKYYSILIEYLELFCIKNVISLNIVVVRGNYRWKCMSKYKSKFEFKATIFAYYYFIA